MLKQEKNKQQMQGKDGMHTIKPHYNMKFTCVPKSCVVRAHGHNYPSMLADGVAALQM